MRVLKFIVDDETITQDPTCDFSGLFPGSSDQIRAQFTFSHHWKSRVKVAAFWSIMDKEYPPQAINDDGSCDIPIEALEKVAFKIQVLGKRRGGNVVKTNKIVIYKGGNARKAVTT